MKKEPIRVLQIIGIVCGGGVESVVMNYYRNIDRSNVQFDFIVDGYGPTLLDDEIRQMGGKIYNVEPYKGNIFKYMAQIYHIIKKGHYNIVHSHMNTLAVFGLFSAWLAGAKVRIAHNHTTSDKSEGLRFVLKYILRPFVPIFATNRFACSKIAATWMYGNVSDVTIVPNAIDLKKYMFDADVRKNTRTGLNVNNKFIVGHIGRFVPVKNHLFIIKIIKELLKMQVEAELVLVGNGELEEDVRKYANEQGVTNNVMFLGLRTDIPALLNAMDIFILPSLFEGLPVVAVEAQATGLPIIVSNRVTREVKITNELDFLELEAGAKEWAKRIQLHQKKLARTCHVEEFQTAGYDITIAANELEKWYLQQ